MLKPYFHHLDNAMIRTEIHLHFHLFDFYDMLCEAGRTCRSNYTSDHRLAPVGARGLKPEQTGN